MRFMLLMHPNITADEYAEGPDVEAVAEMNAFNEAMVQAGVLLAADGLHPAEEGATVTRRGGEVVVTDGPFSEARDVVGGYWIIDARDRDEAIEWARRVPIGEGPAVEVRQIWDVSEMPDEIREAATLSQEPPEQTVSSR